MTKRKYSGSFGWQWMSGKCHRRISLLPNHRSNKKKYNGDDDKSESNVTTDYEYMTTNSKMEIIIYCWVPSHKGFYGNEKADKNAKESLSLQETVFKIPYVNLKPLIIEYISDK